MLGVLGAGPIAADEEVDVQRANQFLFRRVAGLVAPSVVRIETVGGVQANPDAMTRGGRPGDRSRRRGPFQDDLGSGFRVADGPTTGLVWSSNGYILTSSFNFVRDPALITVLVPDSAGPKRYVADLVARDRVRKLALLKIDATGLPVPDWARREDIRVGQSAVALGRAIGSELPAVSVGIVSATSRMMGHAIQTDAKLSPVNYGGPLVDLRGQVLGICVPMAQRPGELAGVEMYDAGVGFALPRSQVAPIVAKLMAGKSFYRGWLGLQIDPHDPHQVAVVAVADPSPLRSAGVQPGDVLLTVNGKSTKHFGHLVQALYMVPAGETVDLQFHRGLETFAVQVRLARSDELGPLADTAGPFDPSEPLPDKGGKPE
ncbi:MAG: PDZ domain-containing protein [bacterium]|nr:PDZ domain-containing protein [bacterium]